MYSQRYTPLLQLDLELPACPTVDILGRQGQMIERRRSGERHDRASEVNGVESVQLSPPQLASALHAGRWFLGT